MTKWIAVAAIMASLTTHAKAADYAPLVCAKAASATEKTICANYALGQGEARMATLFEITTSLVAMGQRGEIMDDQRKFLKDREACGSNVACIRAAYADRIKQLGAVMSNIQSRGPF